MGAGIFDKYNIINTAPPTEIINKLKLKIIKVSDVYRSEADRPDCDFYAVLRKIIISTVWAYRPPVSLNYVCEQKAFDRSRMGHDSSLTELVHVI